MSGRFGGRRRRGVSGIVELGHRPRPGGGVCGSGRFTQRCVLTPGWGHVTGKGGRDVEISLLLRARVHAVLSVFSPKL